MKKYFFLFISTFLIKNSIADSSYQQIILPQVIFMGDTLEEVILDPVLVKATRLKPVNLTNRDQRYLNKVYPLALKCARVAKKIDEDLKLCKNNRQEKKYLNDVEDILRKEFESTLKDLTTTQGKFFIKLVHRETNQTVYHLLKEYRGGFKTAFWQLGAKFFKLNLKEEYDKNGEDAEIENYIARLDEIYQRNGTKYLIENEKINTPIPGKKR